MDEKWTELIYEVRTKDARAAEGLLGTCSQQGIYVEDYSDMEAMLPLVGAADYVDEALTAKSRDRARIHVYLSETENTSETQTLAQQLLERAGIEFKLTCADLPDTDWANDWKKQHTQHRVGKRLLLCPTWEEPKPKHGDVVLSIDPGGAFGSGEDVTTRLCLQLLEDAVSFGDRVLDMGCGSGVLSVAALLLGAASAIGVDIEKRVLSEAPENAKLNGVSERFSALCGNVLTDEAFRRATGTDYDLICGNMVADVQLLMAPVYAQKLRTGGRLVLSGILDTRENEVKAAMDTAGFALSRIARENEWLALEYTL